MILKLKVSKYDITGLTIMIEKQKNILIELSKNTYFPELKNMYDEEIILLNNLLKQIKKRVYKK